MRAFGRIVLGARWTHEIHTHWKSPHRTRKTSCLKIMRRLSMFVYSFWILSYKHQFQFNSFTNSTVTVTVTLKTTSRNFQHPKLRAVAMLDLHDDVIKWKHFPRYKPFVRGIHRSPVNSRHKHDKGQWHRTHMFSLICAWIKSWVNTRESGDLRRHHAHYAVTVMKFWKAIGLGVGVRVTHYI